jgi:hypothetical protein
MPYLQAIFPNEELRQKVADEIIAEGTAALSAEKANPEDEEEDLCNAQFSLAYGERNEYFVSVIKRTQYI